MSNGPQNIDLAVDPAKPQVVWHECQPLGPSGTWLLEASAGTGKTYQLSSLVTRLVVEQQVPIERILVITFTNAATAELRDRIRARLSQVRDTLKQLLAAGAGGVAVVDQTTRDAVLQTLCVGVG